MRVARVRSGLGVCVVVAIVGIAAPRAHAYPFLALHPGGTPFEGPTDPELSAIWWNPAALGELRGLHLGGVGQVVLDQGSITRDPICASSGLPSACSGATISFPKSSWSTLSGTALGALSWDFKSDNVAVALGVFAPWESHRHVADPNGAAGSTQSPTAYHLRSEDFTTVYVALAAAFRLSRVWHIGVDIAIADSNASVSFDRDAALEPHCASSASSSCAGATWPGGSQTVGRVGYESPAYAERIRASGDGGTFWGALPIPSGLGITLGTLYRVNDRLALGLSYVHMFSIFSSASGYTSGSPSGASVWPAAAAGSPCGAGPCLGGARIDYDIPDVYHLGARVALRADLDLSVWARVVVYGDYGRSTAQQSLVIHLSGTPVDQGGLPGRIVLGHALQPAVAVETGLRYRVRPTLRLGLSVVAETSAVPPGSVDAEALDAPKLDALLGVEWRVARWLRVYGGYDLTAYLFTRATSPSPGDFDPSATVRCVDASYSLDACGKALAGQGLPTSSGSYGLLVHRFDIGTFIDF